MSLVSGVRARPPGGGVRGRADGVRGRSAPCGGGVVLDRSGPCVTAAGLQSSSRTIPCNQELISHNYTQTPVGQKKMSVSL